jgi:hypothetical protein
MLERNAAHVGGCAALLSDGNEPLSHQQLWEQVVMALNRLGVGCGDCVAIVLPQGPELAVTFLAVAAGAPAAPLNPEDVEQEFVYYLDDLQARALILPQGSDSPTRAAAGSLQVPVIELIPREGGAGRFRLSGVSRSLAAPAGFGDRTMSRPCFTPRARLPIQRWCRSLRRICSPPPGARRKGGPKR